MKNLIGFLMVCLLLPAITYAGNYTWTGTTSSAWNVSTNWSPQAIPGSSDTITINTTTTSLVLTGKKTIKRLVMTNDTLNLGGDTLEITGSAGFNGGLIMNGVCYPQGTGLLNFAGTTFDAEIKAKGQIKLNGGVFNSMAYFEHVGSAAGTGTGGNTFNGTTTLKNSGTSAFRLAGTNNDTYNGDLTIISAAPSGSGNMQLSTGGNSYFNGNVVVQSTCVLGISFSSAGLGNSYLASGKTLSIGSGGFVGTLLLRNFTQLGTSSHSLTFNGILNLMNSTFNGALTSSTNNILVSGSNFYGACVFSKNGSSSDYSSGGNHFYSDLTLNNNVTNSSIVRFGSTSGDIYDGNTTFNTSAGTIQVAYADTSDFKGHITTNSIKVSFGAAGGFVNIVGSAEQILSGSAEFSVTKLLMNKPTSHVTLQKPIKVDSLLVLHQGVIKGDSTNKVTIGSLGVVQEGSVQSFIDGTIQKIGNTAFTFPVGDNQEYRPLTMTAPVSLTDKYEAQYFQQPQTFSTTLDTGINYISTCNYWKFERFAGTSNVNFTTTWSTPSCDVFDVDSTKLAGLQNGVWKNLGQMGYTGIDSSGSYSSVGNLQNYKYFVLGHLLFPVANFEFTVDTTTSPVLVNFVNTSRGFPTGTQFIWHYGDSTSNQPNIDSLVSKKNVSHNYLLNRIYTAELKVVTPSQSYSSYKVISTVSSISIAVALDLPKSHPSTSSIPSACYDEFTLVFSITNLLDEGAGNELVLNLLSSSFGGIAQAIVDPSNTAVSTSITNNNSTLAFNYTDPGGGPPAPYAGDLKVTILLNKCDLFDIDPNINLLQIDFQLNVTTTIQDLGTFTLGPSLIQSGTPGALTRNFKVDAIDIPKITISAITSGTQLTHDDEKFTRYEIVDRYYDIEGVEGITDLFSLDINLEDDVELISLSVVDPNAVNPDYLIFNSPLNPYVGTNGPLTIVFAAPTSGGVNLPTTTTPTDPNTNQIVLADLSSAIQTSQPIIPPPFIYGLYFDGGVSNKIRIRERLRIKEVSNCANIQLPIESNSIYTLTQHCNRDYTITGCDQTNYSFNVSSQLVERKFVTSPEIRTTTTTGSTYTPILDGDLRACLGPQLDYSIVLRNTVPAPTQNEPLGSGTVKLVNCTIYYDEQHFEFSALEFGQVNLPFTKLGTGILVVNFNGFGTNPEPLKSPFPITNQFNNDYPSSPTDWVFLGPNEEIGITFVDLKLRNHSDGLYDLRDVKHKKLKLTDYIIIKYENMCDLGTSTSSVFNSGDQIQLFNRFEGNATSTAKPLDVFPGQTISNLVFNFENTSDVNGVTYPTEFTPWQIMDRNSQARSKLFNCPDEEFYISLELPSSIYTPLNATITDFDPSTNSIVTIQSIPPIQTSNPLIYEYHWPGSFQSPEFTINMDVQLNCDNGFGIDDFKAEFRSVCDANCDPETYITYAKSEISLHRHCYGICPDDSYVGTKNFNIDRTTMGWNTENDFHANPSVPNGNGDQERVYPCDVVKVTSTKGSSGIDLTNLGIPTFNNLYFDILVEQSQIFGSNNQPLPSTVNLFSGISLQPGSFHEFRVKPINGPNSQCLNQTFTIPFSSTDMAQVTSYRTGYYVFRFYANMNYQTCASMSLRDLLKNYYCELEFEADLIISDLNVSPGAYTLNAVMGQFTFDYEVLSPPSIEFQESCDPYIDNLKYLKINPIVSTSFTGPNNPYLTTDQCQVVYLLEADVTGGYNNGDDFPNEFRPIFIFPTSISTIHRNELSFTNGYFGDESSYTLYNYSLSGNTPVGSLTSSTDVSINTGNTSIAVEKNSNSKRRVILFYDRTCPLSPQVATPPYLELTDFNNIIVGGCSGSATFQDQFNLTNPDNFDDGILSFQFYNPPQSLNSNFVPSPVHVRINYNNNARSTLTRDVWIRFLENNNASFTYTLRDFGTSNEVNYALTASNEKIYLLGDIIQGAYKDYDLYIDWNPTDCPSANGDFVINAEYGSSCTGYQPPIEDHTINSSCGSFTTNVDYVINPPASILSSQLINGSSVPQSIASCDEVNLKFDVKSLQGDISAGTFTITVNNGVYLNVVSSEVQIPIQGGFSLIPLSSITCMTQNIGTSQTEYVFNIMDLLEFDFGIIPPHFNFDCLHNTIRFNLFFGVQAPFIAGSPLGITYKLSGYSSCNELIAENPQAVNIFHNGTTIPPALVINQTGTLCNGSPVTLALQSIPSGFSSPVWSTGATTNSITVSTPGIYYVSVTDVLGCSANGSIIINDNTPNVLLVSSINGYCAGGPFPVLSNSQDPVSPFQYTYLWSNGSSSPILALNAAPNNIYTVTVTGTNGCSTVGSITVPDNTPTINITPNGTVDFCNSGSTIGQLLSAGVSPLGSSVVWSSGSSGLTYTANPSVTGIYTATVTNNGCSVTSAPVTVNNITPQFAIVSNQPLGYCPPNPVQLSVNQTNAGYSYLWSNGSTAASIPVMPVAATTFTVTVTNGSCSSQQSILVNNISPLVTLQNISGTTEYCPPNPIHLMADAIPTTSVQTDGTILPINYNYSWQPLPDPGVSNMFAQPTGSQVYTVTATNVYGCSSQASISLTNLAPINVTPNPAYGCVGDQITLTENACIGCSYVWSTGVQTSSTTTTVQSPNYAVSLTVTSATGCVNSQSIPIFNLSPVLSVPTQPIISPGFNLPVTVQVNCSNCSNTTFAWEQNGIPIPQQTSASFIASPSATTVYTAIVTNYDPSLTIACVSQINSTVIVPNPQSIYCPGTNIIDQGVIDAAGSNYVVQPGIWQINKDLFINGGQTFTVSPGATLEFADHVGLYLNTGANLYIEFGATLRSCNNVVWRGIVGSPGSNITIVGTPSNPTYIEDAEIAIESWGATINSILHITGEVHFNANDKSIYLHSGDYISSHFWGTIFECTKQMDIPYNNNPGSSIHVELIDAGSVNFNQRGSSSIYCNEFRSARTSILSTRTNLLVDGCLFDQTVYNYPNVGNIFAAAINFKGSEVIDDPNTLYSCQVGNISSLNPPNLFYNCWRGIRLRDRVNTQITRNEFQSCRIGINSGLNALSTNSAKFGRIGIYYNDFYNVLERGIELSDNFDIPINISYNKFNMATWTTFSLATESRVGIIINNSTLSLNALEISYNELRHCRTGIQLMQQNRGSIWHNDVFFEVPDADLTYANLVFRRGFRAQNCVGLDFYRNSASRLPTTVYTLNDDMTDKTSFGTNGTLICGFSEEDGGNIYNDNDVVNLPTHFRLVGNVGASAFTCNTLQQGIEGFKLENAQIGTQGAVNAPNGNTWDQWPQFGAFTTVSRIRSLTPIFASWYYQSGQQDQDPTDGGNLQIPNGLAPLQTGGVSCVPCPPCAVERLYNILSNIDSVYSTEEDRFLAKTYLYQQLKDSLQLLYSGSTHDIELQNFFTTMGLNNVGLLSNVEEMLADNDYASAQLFNELINTTLLAEENTNKVNEICAEYNLRFELLDSARRAELEQIAYQHPLIGGPAVYRARAILGIDIDDTQLAFRQYIINTIQRNLPELSLVPNPSSGRVDVFVSLQEEEIKTIEVFNLSGIRVYNEAPIEHAGKISLNLDFCPEGIYQVRVVLDSGRELIEKLVLIGKR